MKLQELYSLRRDFTIIGLTGRVGAGCTEIAQKLSDENYIQKFDINNYESLSKPDDLKFDICYNYLKHGDNWQAFKIISYKSVLLFHLLHEANKFDNNIEGFINIVFQNGENEVDRKDWSNRFDKKDDVEFLTPLRTFLEEYQKVFECEKFFGCEDLNEFLKDEDKKYNVADFFFGVDFQHFSDSIYDFLNSYNITKRTRLFHDLANNLRAYGTVINLQDNSQKDIDNIYTIADTINRIIKGWRKKNGKCKIVIDALKNSLELMFFKEKYSAFYMVASNKEDLVRRNLIKEKIRAKYSSDKSKQHSEEILKLDETEYKSNDHKKGEFSTPDIENCIQKSDYHLFINYDIGINKHYLTIDSQIIKLLALINQPGIVTPTAIERTMQVAYNAKFNSGCISRQVGAVITDEFFTVKSIGWNDVPQGQIPCNLRNANDLVNSNKNQEIFSDFEKGIGVYEDGETFLKKFTEEFSKSDLTTLNGRNCSFCFKSFQNAFEGEKNQVHTRSLHAEENAMMQITKYGGMGLKGGNLFTTASPCELCSKKAFQLGIKNIYYIDPYPGIATLHTLKSGFKMENNPILIMFQGAVGRAFHKLYEPFMAYKDELSILTKINPKPSVENQIKNLIKDKDLSKRIINKIKGMTDTDKIIYLEKYIGIMLEKTDD